MTMIRRRQKLQNCLDNSDDYVNKWTLAILALLLLMATSVTLAITFPYQGGELIPPPPPADGDKMGNIGSSNEKKNVEVGDNNKLGGDNDLLLEEEEDEPTEEELSSPPLHGTNNAAAAGSKEGYIGGLFGPATTTTDEHEKPYAQTNASDINNSSSSSSLPACQMKLQQADTNMDSIIDSSEYITFLNHVVVGYGEDTANNIIPTSITQFDKLPNEYQVNFTHLATSKHAGAVDNNDEPGIPISTIEEMQKVCLYISHKGSSAVGEFDWSQISSPSSSP